MQVSAKTFNPVMVDFYEQVGYLPERSSTTWSCWVGRWTTRPRILAAKESSSTSRSNGSTGRRPASTRRSFGRSRTGTCSGCRWRRRWNWSCRSAACPACRFAIDGHRKREDRTRRSCPAGICIKTAGDILDYSYFFVADDKLVYDEKAVAKSLQKPGAIELLAAYKHQLAAAEAFDTASLEQMTHAFVAARDMKIGDIVHALCAAVTGQSIGLGLFDSLAILGKPSCLADRAAPETFKSSVSGIAQASEFLRYPSVK